MTTEELDRDLEMLAEPRDGDERLRLAIRARLGEQMLVHPRRRHRPWRGVGWAAVAAAAIAAAIVIPWLAGRIRGAVRRRRGDYPPCASSDHVAGERRSVI